MPSTGGPLSATAAAGEQIYRETGCLACHGPAGAGGRAPAVAPLIAGITNAHLVQVLQNPNPKMKTEEECRLLRGHRSKWVHWLLT